MDPLLGALWLLGIIYAGGKAWSHATTARQSSRGSRGRFQHAAAWWTREATRGFPQHRAGFQSGWLAHKTALDHRRAKREEAKTTHLETRASILSEVREHRRRQAEAQALIDQAGQPFLDEVAQRRAAAKKKMRDADEALQDNAEAEKKAGIDYETPRYLDLNDAYWEARQEYQDAKRKPAAGCLTQEERDANGYGNSCAACGGPGTEEDPLLHGRTIGTKVHQSHLTDPESGLFEPSTEGETVATTTDVNYTQALEQADRLKNEVEQAIHEIQWEEMGNTVDQLGAMLNGDRDSVAAAADVADELRQARKQLEQTLDAVQELRDTLVRNHGGIKEAVDDSPVDQAAQPEFYND